MGPIVDSAVVDVAGWVDDAFAWYAEEAVVLDRGDYFEDVALRTFGVTLTVDGQQATVPLADERSRLEGADTVDGLDLSGSVPFHQQLSAASRHRDAWDGAWGQFELRLGGTVVPRTPAPAFHALGEEGAEFWGGRFESDAAVADDERRVMGRHKQIANYEAEVMYRRCSARKRVVLPMYWPDGFMAGPPVPGWVEAVAKPDGQWVALVVSAEPYRHMRAGKHDRRGIVALVPTGPETQLLHPPAASAEAVTAFGDALSPSFVVTHVGPATAERATSVVFAAPGWEEAAATLAAGVPGGATVEPLTWDVPTACLVVALGASAEAVWAN